MFFQKIKRFSPYLCTTAISESVNKTIYKCTPSPFQECGGGGAKTVPVRHTHTFETIEKNRNMQLKI